MDKSIFDEYALSKDRLEGLVGVGMTPHQIKTIFGRTDQEMDEWCKEAYGGMNFDTVYEALRQMAIAEFMDTMRILGERGNQSAIGIMNQALRSLNDQQKTVRIVFDGGLPKESEGGSEGGSEGESLDSSGTPSGPEGEAHEG